ncbi:MAG: LysR family transcriptional regulator [Phototrophicaceae bacterium]
MNLSQLEVLVAIVETGSLKEAAEVVGLTHSAVSYSLSKLEAELGITLMDRGRQRIVLTGIGNEVLQHARSIISEIDVIRQKTARERGLSVGKIRFACVPQVPARFLTGIIREFQGKYPDIQVVLFQGSSTEIADWMENKIIDVGTVVDASLYPASVKLVENEIHVLLPENHALAQKSELQILDVLNEPLIGSQREADASNTMIFGSNPLNIQLRYQVTETATIYAMVAEGMGICILPSMLVDASLPGVVSRPLRPKLMMDAYLAATVDSPASQVFLEVAQNWSRLHGFLLSDT